MSSVYCLHMHINSVQFNSRWHLCTRGKSTGVGLTDDGHKSYPFKALCQPFPLLCLLSQGSWWSYVLGYACRLCLELLHTPNLLGRRPLVLADFSATELDHVKGIRFKGVLKVDVKECHMAVWTSPSISHFLQQAYWIPENGCMHMSLLKPNNSRIA